MPAERAQGPHHPVERARTALVAVVRTSPESVLQDFGRVMELARYRETLDPAGQTLLKLNLSWTRYFPACSTEPWQLDGVVTQVADRWVHARSAVPGREQDRGHRPACRAPQRIGGSRC